MYLFVCGAGAGARLCVGAARSQWRCAPVHGETQLQRVYPDAGVCLVCPTRKSYFRLNLFGECIGGISRSSYRIVYRFRFNVLSNVFWCLIRTLKHRKEPGCPVAITTPVMSMDWLIASVRKSTSSIPIRSSGNLQTRRWRNQRSSSKKPFKSDRNMFPSNLESVKTIPTRNTALFQRD